MANQNRTTKPQPTQGSAAARQAAQAPAADAAKMAKQAADKAELDKMAQAKQAEAVKEVVAETTAEGSVATADAAAAAEGSLGAVSGEAAVAEAGAAGAAGTAAAISPLAIGAGVVGVVAVAAAAGGGSSGGSSSQPIAQNNTQQATQNQGSQKPATPAVEQPAQDAKPAEATQPAQDAKPAEPAKEEPAKQADSKPADQPKVDPTPVEDLTKPATAAGTAAEPKVAADGVTNLTKFADLFETAGANGGKAEYIKISRILSAENAKDAEARAVDSDNSRAYEVIDAGKPITLAEAQAMAAKLGGKLMSIDSAAEKAWLDKNLFGALGEYDGDKSLAEAAAKGDSDKAAQQKVLDGQLASNGAWLGKNATEGADAKANAVIRNGNNAEGDGAMKLYEAAGTTLSKFVIEYEGYKSPLLLNGKPVVEGQIINKADAAKLAWNADLNKGGQITYQAVDSNDAATAKPVANAKAGTMTLSESAEVKHPMTVPTNPSAQDQPAQGGTGGKPANDVPQADKTGQDTQNSDHQPAKPELPATAQGTAEAPQVAANGETKLANAAELFAKAGANGAAADYIKITHIYSAEGSNAEARVVRYHDAQSDVQKKDVAGETKVTTPVATAYEVIDAGKPITRADAEAMAKKLGGKLLSIDDAQEAQWLSEHIIAKLGQQGEAKDNSAAAWMNSKVEAQANAVIRTGDGRADGEAFKFAQVNVGEAKLSHFVIEYDNYKSPLLLNGQPVAEGQIISKVDADKLSWNADQSTTGKITYVAVQSNKPDAPNVEGAEAKTLTVSESAAVTHPTAPAAAPAQNQQQGGAGTHEAQDNKGQAGGEGQKGEQKAGDPQKGGEHGADDGVHKADTPQNSTTGGDANKGNTDSGSSGTGGAVVKPNPAVEQQTGSTGVQGGSKTQEGGSDSKAGDTTQNAGSQSQGQTPPSKPAGTPVQNGDQTDSPAPVKAAPSYEPNKSVSVAHDATDAKIAKEVFEGTNPANRPEAVKVTGFAAGTLKVDGQAINPGERIAAENFDKVTWDASKGEGGSFKFTPVQANGDALAKGGDEQTITINEASAPVQAKPAPTYDANKSVDVAHDATDAKIAKEVFEGTTPANKPAAVTVTGFTAGTLKVDGQAINPGERIAAENFDKVTWDASKGEGGSFKFTPVQANGDALKDATEQTITINEASAPVQAKPAPTYDANKTVDVAHDVTDAKIAKEVFEGTTPANKPAAVTVTGFTAGTLKVDGQAINPGDKIAAENFDKVTWDASKGEGGTFKFTPVQANGDALAQGGAEQTITINEAPAAPVVNTEPKVGEYSAEAVKFDVAHDAAKTALLTKDSQTSPFAGTDADKAPDAVKIVSVHGPDGENTNANIMTLGDGDSARNLTAGQFIDKADFSRVQWNADVDHGSGTYKVQFVPVTSDHKDIANAQTQTFTVKEAAEQPDYSTTTFSAAAEHNGDATFGKAMFDGTDAAKAPMYIRITEINPSNTEAGDKALYLDNKPSVELKVDEQNPGKTILAQSDFEHLRWNAAHNEGGTFKFTALDGDMKPINPSVVHTVTVTEKDAPQAISHPSLFGASEGQGPLTISAKSLAYTPAEPSSNLLDDLHNQITPLI